jgi:hypothetical protein
MSFFHGDPAASVAHKFHGRQLIFAYVGGLCFRRSAEAAFCFIAAGIAQMTRRISHRTAGFTCICHN